ncbi:hypothetical protein [Shinella sp.]|uniref:hypothetical protein n=1 Tax=Shinella sp. TaxID=1870904 RepID=UPI00258748AF|nr:hypothetical protein [Shinella sp.]MCW5712533.1 hypothetical protein [Shinella sp.]
MSADLRAALRDEDAHCGRVGLDGPDRVLHVVMGTEVLDGDHIAILIVAAVQIHRRIGQPLRRQFGLSDEAEGMLAFAPVAALPPSMLMIL